METTPETIIQKIEAIVYELQELQRTLQAQTRPSAPNLAEQLFGALGKGTWDEYELHLDWQRFAS
jgi:hypothetical protein